MTFVLADILTWDKIKQVMEEEKKARIELASRMESRLEDAEKETLSLKRVFNDLIKKWTKSNEKQDKVFDLLVGDTEFLQEGLIKTVINMKQNLETDKPQMDEIKQAWPGILTTTSTVNGIMEPLKDMVADYTARKWLRKWSGVKDVTGFIGFLISIITLGLFLFQMINK